MPKSLYKSENVRYNIQEEELQFICNCFSEFLCAKEIVMRFTSDSHGLGYHDYYHLIEPVAELIGITENDLHPLAR